MFDTHKNFAIGAVLSAPADASGEVFILMPDDGQFFEPNMPVTLCPPNVQPTADNSELGYLRAVDGDNFTITRAQEGSLPMQVASNWQVFGSVTAKSLQDIEETLTATMTQLEGKQPAGEYATDDELAAGLAGKAAIGHNHSLADIADYEPFDPTAINAAIATKADTSAVIAALETVDSELAKDMVVALNRDGASVVRIS